MKTILVIDDMPLYPDEWSTANGTTFRGGYGGMFMGNIEVKLTYPSKIMQEPRYGKVIIELSIFNVRYPYWIKEFGGHLPVEGHALIEGVLLDEMPEGKFETLDFESIKAKFNNPPTVDRTEGRETMWETVGLLGHYGEDWK